MSDGGFRVSEELDLAPVSTRMRKRGLGFRKAFRIDKS